MRIIFGAIASAMIGMFFIGNAAAQSRERPTDSPCLDQELVESGTVEGKVTVTGFLVGVRWGEGVLTLNDGRVFKYRTKGMKTLEIGVAKVQYAGTVYNLDRIEDFTGTYVGIGSGFALIKGLGGMSVGNGKCVIVNAKSKSSGVHLTSPLGPGGVTVQLVN